MEVIASTDRTNEPSARGSGSNPGRRELSVDDRALADFMRKVGANPFLDRQEEVVQTTELEHSRREFAELVHRLPQEERNLILAGCTVLTRGGRWPLQQIDLCHNRLAQLAPSLDRSVADRILPEAEQLKVTIDAVRDLLIRSNLRFVVKVAREYVGRSIPFVDLVQEGALGLMTAIDRFEGERGNRLVTYAYWWIKRSINLAVETKSRVIRVPRSFRYRLGRMTQATRELRESLGRQPTLQEIADKLGTPVSKVHATTITAPDPTPLESSGTDDPDLLEVVSDPDELSPLETTLDQEKKLRLMAAIERLQPHEQRVLRLRYGLDDSPGRTLKQVGKLMKLSRERIRQIERGALAELRFVKDVRDLGSHLDL